MKKKSFSTRRFAMSDVSNVVQLFQNAFKSRFSREWWNWKYKLNPAGFRGEQGDIWIAEDRNEVVGHWAIIPEKMKLGPETITVAQACDAAIHPEYRRLGIFKTLAKKVCSAAQNRYSFIFGFPNEVIHKGYLKLGWKDFRITEFYKFLDYDRPFGSFFTSDFLVWSGKAVFKALRAAKYLSPSLRLKKYTGSPVEIQNVEQFPREIDIFWKLTRWEYEAVLERTSSFLNWRFSKHFGNYQIYIARSIEKGTLLGYLVLKKTETQKIKNVLDIVDLQTLPGEDRCVFNLIDVAIAIGKEEGLDLIHCRIPRWHKYTKILYRLGFISIDRMFRWTKIYQPRLILYQFPEKGKIPTQQEWFVTLADTDDA